MLRFGVVVSGLLDRAIQAGAKAIFDEEGPECIDDDGAEASALVAFRAMLPVVLDEIERRLIKVPVTTRLGNAEFAVNVRDNALRELAAVRADVVGDTTPNPSGETQ